jgi:hypothetical protein
MKTLLLLSLAVIVAFVALDASAADARTGVWTAEINDARVQLSIFPGRTESSRNFDGSRFNYGGNIIGFRVPLAKLTGLTGADGDVKFTLRAAAGTIDFDGHFKDGLGAGHFNFDSSDEFVRDMAQLGYTEFKQDSLLIYATHDLSPALIRELRAMGYQPSRRELDDIAIFRISPEVIREFATLGYPNLTLRELVNLRVGDVDAEYIAAMKALGYANVPARDLADMAILGVRPDYVRDLRAAGLTNLTTRNLRDLRVGNITSKKIEAYKHLGYDLSVRDLQEFGVQGVTPDYIESMKKALGDDLKPRQLIEMKIFGVTPEYIKKMNEIGVRDVRKMIELRQNGAAEILLRKQSK